MVATIIGWYGTETMGDIAILDGILSILQKKNIKKVYLGSLFQFYTERTLFEEQDIFRKNAPDIEIETFNSKNQDIANQKIMDSDLLIMGGGPLMDIEELYIIDRCFQYAYRHNKETYVFGCGIGPLFKNKYRDLVKSFFSHSKKIALRDLDSVEYAKKIYPLSITNKIEYVGDPAVISVENYKFDGHIKGYKEDIVSVNLRKYFASIYQHDSCFTEEDYIQMIDKICSKGKKVNLVPMINFSAGYDDRRYLTEIWLKGKWSNVKVIHKPFNLYELYSYYESSFGTIGMRHHSVVMQTILNGNNIILDYTEPNYGKTWGYIKTLGTEYYDNRVAFLQSDQKPSVDAIVDKLFENSHYSYDKSTIEEQYLEWLD